MDVSSKGNKEILKPSDEDAQNCKASFMMQKRRIEFCESVGRTRKPSDIISALGDGAISRDSIEDVDQVSVQHAMND